MSNIEITDFLKQNILQKTKLYLIFFVISNYLYLEFQVIIPKQETLYFLDYFGVSMKKKKTVI